MKNPQWATYCNLDESYIIHETIKPGSIKRVKISFNYVLAEDFFRLSNLRGKRILRTDRNRPITDKQNDHYDLVIKEHQGSATRLLGNRYWQKERIRQKAEPEYFTLFTSYIHTQGNDCYDVFIQDSELVIQMGKKVRDYLGEYYVLHYRAPQIGEQIFKEGEWDSEMSGQMITMEELARRLPKHFSPGSRVYILSNVWEDDYFKRLIQDYRVFCYYDFPELKRLIEKDKNTTLLFVIEQYLARHAQKIVAVKYITSAGNQPSVRYMLEPITID